MIDIHVLQLNCGKRGASHDAILHYLHNKWDKRWVLCLQEPYKTTKGVGQLPRSMEAFWQEGPGEKARALIIAPKCLGGYLVTQYSHKDCAVVRFLQGKVSIISAYCDGFLPVNCCWTMIEKECEMVNRVIVCTDANGTHAVWGGRRGHRRGRARGVEILDRIDRIGLEICNDPESAPTYRGPVGRTSHIDVTCATTAAAGHVEGWKVLGHDFSSDHKAIYFRYVNIGIPRITKGNETIPIPWKKPSKKGEAMIDEHLVKKVVFRTKIRSAEEVKAFWEQHEWEVQNALRSLFPERKNRTRSRCFWWTEEVREAYDAWRKSRLKYRRERRRRRESDLVELMQLEEVVKEKRGRWRYEVKKAKVESWRRFTSGISDPWSGLHKILKAVNIGKAKYATLFNAEGKYDMDISGTLTSLGKQFFPALPDPEEQHLKMEKWVEEQLDISEAGPRVTRLELSQALKEMSTSAAPGNDMITTNVIKKLMTSGWETQYLQLYNACLLTNTIPKKWKEAKIVLIPKGGAVSTSMKSVRPISLTAIHGKILERIVNKRLQHELEVTGVLATSQHAYRKGGSTITALYEAATTIESALGRKWVCQAIFLDISGAFDRAWHSGILHELLQYNVSKYLVAWLREYLSGRTATFEAGDVRHKVELQQGCPQGGVLSPLLWNVIFNRLLMLKEESVPTGSPPICIIGYADDALVLCQARTASTAASRLRRFVIQIEDWARRYRVVFNPAKMSSIIFTKSVAVRRRQTGSGVSFNGVEIRLVQQYKYLGILLDARWKWDAQIEACQEKLRTVIRLFRGCLRESWGVKKQIMRCFFDAIFKPIMLYAAPIWASGAQTKAKQKGFDRLIRQFAIMTTRTFRTISQEVLLQIMDVRPFKELLEEELMRVSILQLQMVGSDFRRGPDRLTSLKVDKTLAMTWRGLDPLVQELHHPNLLHHYEEHPTKWHRVNGKYADRIFSAWASLMTSGWILYTDASASSYGRGWAVAVYRHGILNASKYGSLPQSSIFTAELHAIQQAAVMISEWCMKGPEIVEIRSDSLACVRALERCVIVDPNLRACKQALRDRTEEGYNVVLRWIPSHEGIEGNEFADRLSKKAVDSKVMTNAAVVARDARRIIGQKLSRLEETRFNNIDSTPFRWFFPTRCKVKQYTNMERSAQLNQLVSGHCRVNNYLGRIGAVETRECGCGEGEETVEHFLCVCSNHNSHRMNIWGKESLEFEEVIHGGWDPIEEYLLATRRLEKKG